MKIRKFAALLLAVFLSLISVFSVYAQEYSAGSYQGSADTNSGIIDILPLGSPLGVTLNNTEFPYLRYVNVKFCTPYETAVTWDFPYSDEFFSQPQNEYSHVFAQGSLGLAVASFRSTLVNHNGYSDLESYFTSIGFGNISAEPFLSEPTANSVTYAIASKKLSDQTVIAVVCCGAGYGKEWSSNLTIGNEVRHKGFGDAADTVEKAVFEYIDTYGISGNVSLWTSGYSRAAAIANLVAADMTDDGTFKGVYCYTFATPHTTKDDKVYQNIFNIVGKNDPVPKIPFADWGFNRYGSDLYTPTIQMDSMFADKIDAVSSLLEQIDGHKYLYNPEVCSQLGTFFDYLYNLLPESTDYYSDLQPGVLSVMANSSNSNLLSLVSQIISTFSPETKEESEEISNLMDYLQQLANQYVLRGNSEQIAAGTWDPKLNITQNLTIEHDPDNYVAWMFLSNDPELIFGQNTQYRQCTIKGLARIHIYDPDGYIKTIEPDGSINTSAGDTARLENSETPELYIQHGNSQTNISLPSDKSYIIMLESDDPGQITYYATTHTVSSVRADISDIYTMDMKPSNSYFLFFGPESGTWVDDINTEAKVTEALSGTSFYSPSTIMRLQNINFLHLTLFQILIFLLALITFSYSELLICVTLGCVRIFQGHQRRSLPTIIMHLLNAVIFLAIEIALWYFVPAYPIARLVSKIISFIFIFSLAFVALTEYFSKRNIFLTLGVAIFMILSFIFEDMLLPRVSVQNVLLKISFYALLSAASALTWLGHTRRRAFKIAAIEKKRHEKKMAKAERDMQKAYDKSEKATQKYILKQQKAQAKKANAKN